MSQIIPRYRDLWRFRAPLSAGEIRRTERWLASARVALTIAALITLWMEPARGGAYSPWLYWLLTIYLVHSVVVMLLVRFRHNSTRAFRLVVHGADIAASFARIAQAYDEPFGNSSALPVYYCARLAKEHGVDITRIKPLE